MEATAARWAENSLRLGSPPPGQSNIYAHLKSLIRAATDPLRANPYKKEDNYHLTSLVVEEVNKKEGNPHVAAVTIINLVNALNPQTGKLALELLDQCIKNCGYPFHLQLAIKDHLNQLVRRFPAAPPERGFVQSTILRFIETWRRTLCESSEHREDFGLIRAMHALLRRRGFIFPEPDPMDLDLLNSGGGFRTAQQMEEETRRAQEAKFRDLIRQGGPENLQEANRLAKILSGYDQRDKEKFRMKAADEIIRIQEEAKLLEERLQNFRPGDDMADGDVFEEVANSLMSEQPKLLKISKQESGDEEAVQRIKGLVENIDRTIERYRLMKAGDIVGANRIAQGAFGGDAPTSAAGKQEELSLIDFDSGQSNGASSGVPEHGSSMEDDLLGLSMQEPASAQNGGLGPLFLGSDNTMPTAFSPTTSNSTVFQPSGNPQVQQSSKAPVPALSKPNYNAFSPFPTPRTGTPNPPAPSLVQSSRLPQAQRPAPSTDPFDILASAKPQPSAPLSQLPSPAPNAKQQPQPPGRAPHPSSLLDLGSDAPPPPPTRQMGTSNGTTADDDWGFGAAVLPEEDDILVTDGETRIRFEVKRQSESVIGFLAKFSNTTTSPITSLAFQIATPKSIVYKQEKQSGARLEARQVDGVTQRLLVSGIPKGQAKDLKMKWRLTYRSGDQPKEAQGLVPQLAIE